MPGLDIHAGIWRALEASGIKATHNSGTSAGAVAAAFDSTGWTSHRFEDYLRGYSDSSLRHEYLGWRLRLPWLESIHDNDRIRGSLEASLSPDWSAMQKPLQIWAARLRDGGLCNVARPEVAQFPSDAVLASMSISGFFPAVELDDGECYVDGGVRFNLPLPSDWREYEAVYLLVASPRPQDYPRRSGILTNLIRNVQILALDQIQDVLDETAGAPNVHVIWPDVSSNRGMLHRCGWRQGGWSSGVRG